MPTENDFRNTTFWRDVLRGFEQGSFWLSPAWLALLVYCLWEIVHGR